MYGSRMEGGSLTISRLRQAEQVNCTPQTNSPGTGITIKKQGGLVGATDN